MRNTIKRISMLLLAFLSAVILLSACKYEVMISVEEDGDAEIEAIVAFSDFIISMAGGSDEMLSEMMDDMSAEMDESTNFELKPYNEAGYTGIRAKVPFDPYNLSNLDDISMFNFLPDQDLLGEIVFKRNEDDTGWSFLIDQKLQGNLLGEINEGIEEFTGDDSMLGMNIPIPIITLKLRLPGEIVEHNADRVVDGVLVWDVDLSEDILIHSESIDTSEELNMAMYIIAGVFGLIFLGIMIAVGVVVVRSLRSNV